MTRPDITKRLISEATRMQADLEVVQQELERDPDEVMARAFPDADPGLGARAIVGARGGLEAAGARAVDDASAEQRRRLLEAGVQALDKLRRDGEAAEFEPDEEVGLEAIVRFAGRPAIMIRDGRFGDPPPPWGVLEEYRDSIQTTARSVGRIHAPGLGVHYAGSGFLVAEDVLMTNCHVAAIFSQLGPDRRWAFLEGVEPSIDYVEDPDNDPPVEFAITELIGIHDRLDMALLRVAVDAPGGQAPQPLVVMSEPPEELATRRVYVLGYPGPDPRNDPVVMRQIFGEIYYVKRLQPGAYITPTPGPVIRLQPCSDQTRDDDVFYHDSSTLGGNSGSCVVDLETNMVVGLHYAGRYSQYNQAVALWKFTDDPLLRTAGVNFD